MLKTSDHLRKLVNRLETASEHLTRAVSDAGSEIVEQMVNNLSGQEVSWSGGTFKINVQTGNLRRRTRMEHPYQGNPLAVGVFNNASYAQQIEEGMSGEDRKQALLKDAKVSKAGRRYRAVPSGRGNLMRFWTVTEDSRLKDTPARPFVDATLEQMKGRFVEMVGSAVVDVIKGEG